MAVELERYRSSRADCPQTAKVGIIMPEARVELTDGEILATSPTSSCSASAPTSTRRSDETPEDVLLIVSGVYGGRIKGPLYACFGIADSWLVDPNRDRVTVYRDPTPDGYATSRVFRRGESISRLGFADLTVAVEDILG